MKCYYIRIQTWGSIAPDIIDEETICKAEQGLNYLDPDEYTFLCEAEHMAAANEYYWDEFSKAAFDQEAERFHP